MTDFDRALCFAMGLPEGHPSINNVKKVFEQYIIGKNKLTAVEVLGNAQSKRKKAQNQLRNKQRELLWGKK
jgi:hypothetical protein